MKIGINTTIQTNIGDDFIREGILFLVRKTLTDFEVVLAQKHITDRWSIDSVRKQISVIKECAIIIQSGAPVYWPDVAYIHSGEWPDLFWRQGKDKSVLALASGSCYPGGWKLNQLTKADKTFISVTIDKSKLITARDEMAVKVVKHVRPDTEIKLFPCTAFWAPEALDVKIDPKYAVLNYMYGASHFWQTEHSGWKKLASDFYRQATRKYGRCMLVCHNKQETTLAKGIGVKQSDVFYSDSYKDYGEVYAKAIIGVANRVHGACIIAGCGIPVINVGIDSRLLVNKFIGARQGHVSNVVRSHTGKSIVDILDKDRKEFREKIKRCKEKYTEPYASLIGKYLNA